MCTCLIHKSHLFLKSYLTVGLFYNSSKNYAKIRCWAHTLNYLENAKNQKNRISAKNYIPSLIELPKLKLSSPIQFYYGFNAYANKIHSHKKTHSLYFQLFFWLKLASKISSNIAFFVIYAIKNNTTWFLCILNARKYIINKEMIFLPYLYARIVFLDFKCLWMIKLNPFSI